MNGAASFEAIARYGAGNNHRVNRERAIHTASYGADYNLPLADSIIHATAGRHETAVPTLKVDFKARVVPVFIQERKPDNMTQGEHLEATVPPQASVATTSRCPAAGLVPACREETR